MLFRCTECLFTQTCVKERLMKAISFIFTVFSCLFLVACATPRAESPAPVETRLIWESVGYQRWQNTQGNMVTSVEINAPGEAQFTQTKPCINAPNRQLRVTWQAGDIQTSNVHGCTGDRWTANVVRHLSQHMYNSYPTAIQYIIDRQIAIRIMGSKKPPPQPARSDPRSQS